MCVNTDGSKQGNAQNLATGGAALGIGGTILSTVGAYNQASATRSAYQYQAQVDANNAQIAQWQASDAIQRGQTEEQNVRLKTAGLISSQRAQMAANGVDLSEGSPIDILATSKFMGERDALQVKDNALRSAWGYTVQANNQTASSEFNKYAASNVSPITSAGSSLLSGATSVADKWYQYSKAS